MKLFFSPASPFVRKVRVAAAVCGLEARITLVPANAFDSPPDLVAVNPLSKIPCLVTEDGLALFDSPVICEYLDEVGDGGLFPTAGPQRWRALRQQALADGLCDAGIARRQEAARPVEPARTKYMERQWGIVLAALDMMEKEPLADHLDIGSIAMIGALGWMDFRHADLGWRETRPKLAAWADRMAARPEFLATAPK